MSLNPGLATSFFFLFFSQMITFVPCNIFEQIWYSEFILEDFLQSQVHAPLRSPKIKSKISIFRRDPVIQNYVQLQLEVDI